MPPINGYLLLADQADKTVIIGKNPITANTANNPKSMSATTQPGATGIRATNAAAVLVVGCLQLSHSKMVLLLAVVLPTTFFQQI